MPMQFWFVSMSTRFSLIPGQRRFFSTNKGYIQSIYYLRRVEYKPYVYFRQHRGPHLPYLVLHFSHSMSDVFLQRGNNCCFLGQNLSIQLLLASSFYFLFIFLKDLSSLHHVTFCFVRSKFHLKNVGIFIVRCCCYMKIQCSV